MGQANSLFSNTPLRPNSWWLRSLIAVASLTAATLTTSVFYEVFRGVPFMLYFPAIIITTWYGGFRVGITVSVLAAIIVNYFFLNTPYSLSFDSISIVQVGVFIAVTTLISWFYETRRRLGETLQRQEEWLRVTLTSIGDAVIATDTRGCITFINPIAASLTKWRQDDALGRDIHEVFRVINEDTRKPVEIPIIEAIKKGVIVGLANHTLLLTRDGREIPISDSGAPIRDASGNIIGAILVFRDMIERREAELALQKSEARYRDLVESANDIIYTLDLQGNFTSINRVGETLTGYGRDELLHSSAAKIIAAEYLPLMSDVLTEKLEGADQTTYELEILTKDRKRLTLEVNSRLLTEDGQPAGVYGIARDITARKRSEEQLRRLQKITSLLSSAPTVNEVINVIVEDALGFMNALSGAIGLMSEDGTLLQIINSFNMQPEILKQFPTLPYRR